MKIAVVGAPGSGKSTLVQALRLALHDHLDLADTAVDEASALAAAVQHDLLRQDRTLYAGALEQHRGYDLTLLMGLDLPPPRHDSGNSTSPAPSPAPSAAQWDARWRQTLDGGAMAYTVVYGRGPARTECALQAIAYHHRQAERRPAAATTAWQWCCDTCSDAACEHRLFSALVQRDSMRP